MAKFDKPFFECRLYLPADGVTDYSETKEFQRFVHDVLRALNSIGKKKPDDKK